MEEAEKAFVRALGFLARRDHSEAELVRKLREKGISAGVIAEVVQRLKDLRYLDDRRFAEQWAQSAVKSGRGYGPRLRQELSQRGVAREIITEVLAGIAAEHDETETLTALIARKFAGFDPMAASDREKRRLFNYLQRRGFSTAVILAYFHIYKQ
ncbi:MAG: regulatory [Geobacteraceae bacterium]|nr:MAG: regulatory [Geobacteraceae bacterium]